jgi:hypothetical protein
MLLINHDFDDDIILLSCKTSMSRIHFVSYSVCWLLLLNEDFMALLVGLMLVVSVHGIMLFENSCCLLALLGVCCCLVAV